MDGVGVSVVIPCYNKAPYIRETLDSALRQTVPPAEIIVVDDGSTDESAAIVESYGSRVILLRQENRGESTARNRGVRRASGRWVAFLDADDRWEPEKLERQLAASAESESTPARESEVTSHPVCVYTDVYRFRGQERLEVERRPDHHAAPDWQVRMLCEWTVQPSSALVRADALRQVRFDESVRDSEDMLFFLELRRLGPFLRVPEPLVGYRLTPTNQSRRSWHTALSVESRWRWFRDHREWYDEAQALRVRSALAAELVKPHDIALWTWRDPALARTCRRLYADIHPDPAGAPASFERRVWPRWVYRVKDFLFERLLRAA